MPNEKNRSTSIKETLKPRRGRIRQGYFVPKNPQKYDGAGAGNPGATKYDALG